MIRRKWKSFFALTTAFFFFCTFVLGCATGKGKGKDYREVSREEGKVSEYYTTPNGERIEAGVVEEALRKGDIQTLTRVSKVYRPTPKEQIAPEEYSVGEVSLYEDYPGGTKFINVGANPQKMKIPDGWWPIGLPKDITMTVGGGKDGKKRTTGTLKQGEVVWVYVVIKDGQPVIDARKGILLQLGAVKRCGNQIFNDIKMWYPLPLLKQAAQKQVEILVLQKVIDRGQAVVYMEKESNAKYWMIGLIVLAAVGGFFIGKSQAGTETRYVDRPSGTPAPNVPVAGEPCPVVPYIGSGGQIVQPAPAPRPAP